MIYHYQIKKGMKSKEKNRLDLEIKLNDDSMLVEIDDQSACYNNAIRVLGDVNHESVSWQPIDKLEKLAEKEAGIFNLLCIVLEVGSKSELPTKIRWYCQETGR